MRTTLNIPDDLVEKATRLAGVKTKTKAIVVALEDFVRRKQIQKLIESSGTLKPRSDWEKMRHGR